LSLRATRDPLPRESKRTRNAKKLSPAKSEVFLRASGGEGGGNG